MTAQPVATLLIVLLISSCSSTDTARDRRDPVHAEAAAPKTPTPAPATPDVTPPPPTPAPTPLKWELEPKSVFGVPFGATESEVEKAVTPMGGYCLETEETGRFCSGKPKMGDITPSAIFSFVHGKMGSVYLTFEPDQFDFLARVFTEKYGSPMSQAQSVVQNRMGATFNQRELEWHGDTVTISLRRYGAKVTEGTATISTHEFMQQFKGVSEANTKKAVDGL